MMTLAQALNFIPGARLAGDGATPVQRVHTDTRTLQPGDLFVALKGERFDANDFIADAVKAGAAAVLAHHGKLPAGVPGIEVDDTRLALGALAAGWRSQFSLPLVAVTGSNGKTTVTQMIASILRAWQGDAALATQGNFNNDIGVPLTLLKSDGSVEKVTIPGSGDPLAAFVNEITNVVQSVQQDKPSAILDGKLGRDALAGMFVMGGTNEALTARFDQVVFTEYAKQPATNNQLRAALVLRDNYFQTQVLSVTNRIAPQLLDAQARILAARQPAHRAQPVEHGAAHAVVRERRERHAVPIIEALRRLDQSLHAEADEVVELHRRHLLAQLACDRAYERDVILDQALVGRLVRAQRAYPRGWLARGRLRSRHRERLYRHRAAAWRAFLRRRARRSRRTFGLSLPPRPGQPLLPPRHSGVSSEAA